MLLFYLYFISYVLVTISLLEGLFVSAQIPAPSSFKPANRVIFDWIDDNGIRRNVNISDMREPYGLIRNLNNRTRIQNPFIRFPYINTPGKKMISVTTTYLSSTNSSVITTKRQNISFDVIDSRCSNELIENSDMSLSHIGYWQASNGTRLRDVTSVFGKSTNAIRQSVIPVSMISSLSQTIGSWWHHLFNLVSSSSTTTTITSATSTTTSYITTTSISDGLMYMKNITLSCLRPGTSWNIIARIGLISTGRNTATGAMCQVSTRASVAKTSCPIIIITFFGMKNEMLFFHIIDTYQSNQWNSNDWNILNSTMIIPSSAANNIRSMRVVITSYNGTTTTVSGTDYVLNSFSIIPKL